MTTISEICDEVLLNIGEGPSSQGSHPVTKKIFAAYTSSVRHVSTLYKWPHLIKVRTPSVTSGPGGVFEFFEPGIQTIIDVVYVETPGISYRLTSNERRNLWACHNVYQPAPGMSTLPTHWSAAGSSQIRLFPAPTTLQLANVRCLVVNEPDLSQDLASSAAVQLPNDFIQAVKYHMEFLMHMRHTADANSANAALSTFEQYVHMLRSRKSG